MVSLDLSLNQDSAGHLYNTLICLARFSETITIEVKIDKLILISLNDAKSSHASFTLDAKAFFSHYKFIPNHTSKKPKFSFQISNRAFLSAFKDRAGDAKSKDISVDRWLISLREDDDTVQCQIVIKAMCREGVSKTFNLSYEPADVMHALFNKASADNNWCISALTLKEYINLFGSKTEQLDIYMSDEKVHFVAFTEKILNAKKEVLKHPLQTTVTMDAQDFEVCSVITSLHIFVSVNDFKAIVTHAASLNEQIFASYSRPARPLQFSYTSGGLKALFTLMTAGEYNGPADYQRYELNSTINANIPITATTAMEEVSVPIIPPCENTESTTSEQNEIDKVNMRRVRNASTELLGKDFELMVDKSRRSSFNRQNHSARAFNSIREAERESDYRNNDNLFVSQNDEDRDDQQWNPPAFDGEPEEFLIWDTTDNANTEHQKLETEMPPTQKLVQIKGLW